MNADERKRKKQEREQKKQEMLALYGEEVLFAKTRGTYVEGNLVLPLIVQLTLLVMRRVSD